MFFSFEIGDYLLHAKYGIARLVALEHIELNGNTYEFLKLEYADAAFVFIPVFRIDILKLHSKNGSNTIIDTIGKSKILQKKQKLKQEIAKIAHELAKIAAIRAQMKVDSLDIEKIEQDYKDFSNKVPFELTLSQKRAIEEIFSDIKQTKPMDRLLCADVGFGKTEVALHSIFVAIKSKKQVLFIVPTTILAQQHYQLVQERFGEFGIKCGLVSRITDLDASDVLTKWSDGEIDILIATASNKGIEKFLKANIGLIILDEEHHFGAEFKENARKIGHFLQLSATPIPRTLNLALSKIKDISVLETPPMDKQDIAIHVVCEDEVFNQEEEIVNVIVNASEKENAQEEDDDFDFVSRDSKYEDAKFDFEKIVHEEIAKNGRVFLVVPRISMIENIEKLLNKFKQKVNYLPMHGRLSSVQIGENLEQFRSGSAPILIGTSIVESGLNVVEANLIIIFSAHMFGIAQLHQLKGRVGRLDQRANVYFITPRLLTEIATKRFEVLQKHDYMGANYSLAMEDLSIRGGGTAIGNKQWGSDYGFGIEAYYELLAEAIAQEDAGIAEQLNMNADQEQELIEFEGFSNAYIPTEFIDDEYIRINFYKKLASVKNEDQLTRIKHELSQFGEMPIQVMNFLEIVVLKHVAQKKGILKICKKIENAGVAYDIVFEKLNHEMLPYLVPFKPDIKKTSKNNIIITLRNIDIIALMKNLKCS